MPTVTPAPDSNPGRSPARPGPMPGPHPSTYLSPEDRRWLADLEYHAALRGLPPR